MGDWKGRTAEQKDLLRRREDRGAEREGGLRRRVGSPESQDWREHGTSAKGKAGL